MIAAFLIAAAVIILDQISKYIVKTNMRLGESFSFIKNILDIHYIENKGASFGILKDQRWIFMILSSVALVFMAAAVVYLGRKNLKKHNRLMNVALALMLGGGIGNMIDRFSNVSVAEPGAKVVVDFIEFAFVNFATFNVADSFITIGSALFGVCMLAGKYRLKEQKDEDCGEK
ncbi:MAG: signal peptidase II [Oscillospiraceae bacterium]|nr:signal peptidase II [Oscillospiraceae bacterium]